MAPRLLENWPASSDGPDSFKGGLQCLSHHAGVTENITDWCCCCNPCLYTRSFFYDHPCRCIPKMICFVFRGDAGQRECCREMATSVAGVTGQYTTTYSALFGGIDITLTLETTYRTTTLLAIGDIYGIPAFWRFKSNALGIDEIFIIDHTYTTCLAPPPIAISGVTIITPDGTECVGEITLELYKSAKVPFTLRNVLPSEDIPIPPRTDPLCKCEFAVDTLCVYGRRKPTSRDNPTPVEAVEFKWDRSLNDRWSYKPECSNPTDLDQEHIYLRGDADGNCYLELDFNQAGDATNDWAVPTNTFDGDNPHEIREGMLPITSCVCGLSVRSTELNTIEGGFRHVVITAGYCHRYKHSFCGECRCVPESICVASNVDGEAFQGSMTWNGSEWVLPDTATVTPFTLSLTTGDCEEPPFGRPDSSICAIKANGTFLGTFNKANITECGPYLSFEMFSQYDPAQPTISNWMTGYASRCGSCKDRNCGPCMLERCGGPPQVLYADLEAVSRAIYFLDNDPALPYWVIEECNLQVTLMYYQKWVSATLFCGYKGSAPLPGGGTFFLDYKYSDAELFRMTRVEASGTTSEDVSFSFLYPTCVPFLKVSEWKDQLVIPWHHCAWGAYDPTHVGHIQYRVTLSE